MSPRPPAAAAPELAAWLEANAEDIDTGQGLAAQILPRLGRAGALRVGVPEELGGAGGTLADAIEAIADVAACSLAAAFVFWAQRAFIEYLLHSPNAALRARWLPQLLRGQFAGATGLSNAMKYLSNLEPLSVTATLLGGGPAERTWTLAGSLPWITNLSRAGFLAAVAVDHADGTPASVFAIPHDVSGVIRSDDLDLVALRSTNTAALRLDGAVLDSSWLLTDDAPPFLARVRPGFLGLQCGLSIGLARRALAAIAEAPAVARSVVAVEAGPLAHELAALSGRLLDGVVHEVFAAAPDTLFELRIALASVVQAAVGLEVQAAGGRGYLRGAGGTARRAREAAFVPIVTPSVVQLKSELAQHRRTRAA